MPTIPQDILGQMIQRQFAEFGNELTDIKFRLTSGLASLQMGLEGVKDRLSNFEVRLGNLETGVSSIEARMVTKTDLEESFNSFEQRLIKKIQTIVEKS